jgi:hypothetical protein
MTPKGRPTVDSVPPARRRPSNDWDAMAIMAQHTGKPTRAGTNVPISKIKSVRTYRRPPFRTDEGHIIINMRNTHHDPDLGTVGDMYFTWAPNEQQKEEN